MATKKLTIKEAKLVKAKAEGKTNLQAYREVYSPTASDATADSNTRKILGKEHITNALRTELERQGISIEQVVKPVTRALQDESIEVQLKGHDRAMKILGANQSETPTINNFGNLLMQQKAKYED